MAEIPIKPSEMFEVGLQVIVEKEFSDKKIKYHSRILGWKENSFVIMELPNVNGAYLRWEMGTSCITKFVNKGNVYGFRSTLIKIIFQPHPLLFLKYPKEIEQISLRAYERIQTFLFTGIYRKVTEEEEGVTTFSYEKVGDGVILDISPGGSLIQMEKTEDMPLEIGEILYIDFFLPDKSEVKKLPIEIRNIRMDETSLNVGVRFSGDENPDAKARIEQFFEKYFDKK